ncbi:MAG: creatininase family protein [Gemmatimonadetes bacterium]|nr:creatininase family protein [Gemmatimonadota bacterium]
MTRIGQTLLLLALAVNGGAAAQGPDTIFLEELTWDEVRARIAAGTTSVIVATAGTEQNGPHMVMGKHRFILEHTTDRIARALGNTLVAPILDYVPEGSWENPRGHMAMPGTITLPNDRFVTLLEHAAKSLRAGGFTDILFIGDSGGNQNGMRDLATRLNQEWRGTGARAHFIGDYYEKSQADARAWITGTLRIAEDRIGSHAGISDTSQLLFVNAQHVRADRRAPGGGSAGSGVTGDPTLATAEIGEMLIRIKIDNAVAQIRASLAARDTGAR